MKEIKASQTGLFEVKINCKNLEQSSLLETILSANGRVQNVHAYVFDKKYWIELKLYASDRLEAEEIAEELFFNATQ